MNPRYKYKIFPDFYDADRQNWLALNCELCSKADKTDFAKLFRAQLLVVVDVIDFIVKHKLEDFELYKAKDNFKANCSNVATNLVMNLMSNTSSAFDALRSLIDFYRRNGFKSMLLGDVESEANWGLTFRDNQPVLVIIDAGFDSDVYNTYYSTNNTSRQAFQS